MTESRTELLNWLNSMLDLNYTKVEQLGSGAAYCQILDSIFLDVPMNRVKFDATKEYEYLNNFKVLQSALVKHKIQKSVPVERLIKCRFQDNLEFFQWIRKFWKENKDESEYDPNSRRKYTPPPSASARATPAQSRRTTPTTSTLSSSRRTASGSSAAGVSSSALPRTRNVSSSSTSAPGSRVVSQQNKQLELELQQTQGALAQVEEELGEYKGALDALESERNFYFNKLREIEILTETTSDLLKEGAASTVEIPSLKDILIKIQEVLYSTEEGFLIPDDNIDEQQLQQEEQHQQQHQQQQQQHAADIDMEEETF